MSASVCPSVLTQAAEAGFLSLSMLRSLANVLESHLVCQITHCNSRGLGSFLHLGDAAPIPVDGIKPTFTERPVIRQSEDGNKITFECRLVGDPIPTVTW